MRIPDSILIDMLISAERIEDGEVEGLQADSKKENLSLQAMVLKKQIISEKQLTKLYAEETKTPYVELSSKKIKKDVLNKVPERIARKYRAVLYEHEDNIPKLAMEDPDDLQAIDFLQKQLGMNLEISIACSHDIQAALDEYKGEIGSEISKVTETHAEQESSANEEVREEDIAEDSPIAQTVNLLVEYAIKQKASDIHIEPRENEVQIRYRIDGVLREANKLPRNISAALISRIKILSNLKIDEHRAPQDGRFKINVSGQLFALRVSTLPIMDGEKVVMRILNESAKALTLEELGYWGYSLKTIRDAITQPHGIILVTGPTGSGKSTTLYSVLNLLNTPGVNISTVEDPVEYRIPGTNQTQVNPKAGMSFANGLRALLRQDPNIIMVGEIRDKETANLAIQAALTGHLVFSTLHTNNAATALPRLLEMGIEPFLIASTVRVVIGQRLVRRLNPAMRESYVPEDTELEEIKDLFKIENAVAQAQQANEQQSKKDDKNPGKKTDQVKIDNKLSLWRGAVPKDAPPGTNHFKGRVGIYEVMKVTERIEKMIVDNGTSNEMQDIAIEDGMVTMQQDGFVKAIQGMTTIEEVLRVTRE
ncbi:type II/IV secretion system protein [Candidatus Saccharibacteria bacterium]|nr:type II/IV secretion system protein [Candidatus Saccharibacteria bacterium]